MINRNILTLIYAILVLFCLSMSAYFSYLGLSRAMNKFALLGAGVITLWLLASDILIRNSRLAGRSMLPPLLMLAVIIPASFVSHFNYLYTNAMHRDVAIKTVATAYETFRANLIQAQTALSETGRIQAIEERRNKLEGELDQLERQITSPMEPGVGDKARRHIERVYQILGSRLTELRQPGIGASQQALQSWYTAFRDAAMADLKRQEAGVFQDSYNGLKRQIAANLEQFRRPQDTATLDDLTILSQLSARSDEIERVTNALLPSNEQLTFRKIDFLDGRLGEIEFSLYNGFIERPNLGTTVLVAVMGLAVDVLPLIYALVAFHHQLSSADSVKPHLLKSQYRVQPLI